ncbi:MAG: LysR family transcriptional regulator [Betaproteobacteria bacterium]|nr:LysR family transcriptional regulator [Betaproteobacteria bacterium]
MTPKSADLRRYDLNLLVVLDALLDEVNVTRAGERVHLSQSATSAALDRLRATFNDPLLVRVKGRMQLTTFARQLKSPLKRALLAVSTTFQPPAEFKPATATTVFRLGMTDYLGYLALPRLRKIMAVAAPRCGIAVTAVLKDAALDQLEDDDLDLVIIVDPPKRPNLHTRPALKERFACVMRSGHRLARATMSNAALLSASHVRVQTHGSARSLVDEALARVGAPPHVAVTVPHFGVALALLKDSDLVAIMPRRIAESQAATLGLAVRDLPFRMPGYGMETCWHLRAHKDPAHVWFRKQLADVMATL